MQKILIFIGVLIGFAASAVAQDEETLATPKYQIAPAYPIACQQALGGDPSPQLVSVVFDVTRDGETENVRVRDSMHECFDEAAITSVRGWTYEPRRIKRSRAAQEDLEVTFKFVLEEPTRAYEFDARPIKRVPPQYPMKCMRSAMNRETVLVMFDVTAGGETTNIAILESSNTCLNDAAQRSVVQWKYSPMEIDGEAVVRPNVQTMITFVLDGGGVTRTDFRSGVRAGLLRAKNLAIKKKDVEGALAQLSALEEKYGDNFSNTELSAFYQVRAAVRIEAGDYVGALDDLMIARRLGVGTAEAAEAINMTVEQLEKALGLKPAETPPLNEDDTAGEDTAAGEQ